MLEATRCRFEEFSRIRNHLSSSKLFWDIVVLTAADTLQKSAFEKQIQEKLDNSVLPSSANYVVVADPPNFKIGNGGSTLVVLKNLKDKFGDNFYFKRIIIIHAGGYSQRLPNASALGKVFLTVPSNEENLQMLDVKLASYIDIPGKILDGGVFVCCSDTFEPYNDTNVEWKFATKGFTALGHLSPLVTGKTHGVFTLESSTKNDIMQRCQKFLHKPTIEVMRSTKNCVHKIDAGNSVEEFVLTDSSFFISPPACESLMKFYNQHSPLSCEIDAYGDFLQCLGTEADLDFINNISNVTNISDELITARIGLYNQLRNCPLYVVVLCSLFPESNSNKSTITSCFYHFGTIEEYLHLFTENKILKDLLSIIPLSYTAGTPFKYKGYSPKNVAALPTITSSVLFSGVVIGERSLIEYSVLAECVSVGEECIVSHCSLTPESVIPPSVFIHTVPVKAQLFGYQFETGYCTVIFGIHDDLKKSSAKSDVGRELLFFGKPLKEIDSNCELAFDGIGTSQVSLWKAKLFPICRTVEESSTVACTFLRKLLIENSSKKNLFAFDRVLLSMDDILHVKDVEMMLYFQTRLKEQIHSLRNKQSFLLAM